LQLAEAAAASGALGKSWVELLPAEDGIGLDEGGIVAGGAVAHAEGVAVGEVVGDVAVIGKGNVGALAGEADVIAAIFGIAMREETSSGVFAPANDGKQHDALLNGMRLTRENMKECDGGGKKGK
jgi:hypothetical protein